MRRRGPLRAARGPGAPVDAAVRRAARPARGPRRLRGGGPGAPRAAGLPGVAQRAGGLRERAGGPGRAGGPHAAHRSGA
ncbi:MAG: hypothetical protein ACK559_05945, partial [bacterium]